MNAQEADVDLVEGVGALNFSAIDDLAVACEVEPQSPSDDVIDQDIILAWGEQRRVITGADILGRLMRGIIQKAEAKNAELTQRQHLRKDPLKI